MTGPTTALHPPAIQTTTFHLDPHTQDPQRRGALSFPPTLTPATTVVVTLGPTPPPPSGLLRGERETQHKTPEKALEKGFKEHQEKPRRLKMGEIF